MLLAVNHFSTHWRVRTAYCLWFFIECLWESHRCDAQGSTDSFRVRDVLRGRARIFQAPKQLIDGATLGIAHADRDIILVRLPKTLARHAAPELQTREVRFGAPSPRAVEVNHSYRRLIGCCTGNEQVRWVEVVVTECTGDQTIKCIIPHHVMGQPGGGGKNLSHFQCILWSFQQK